jgi:hypothetical protein
MAVVGAVAAGADWLVPDGLPQPEKVRAPRTRRRETEEVVRFMNP